MHRACNKNSFYNPLRSGTDAGSHDAETRIGTDASFSSNILLSFDNVMLQFKSPGLEANKYVF